jgi:hypothetical protein
MSHDAPGPMGASKPHYNIALLRTNIQDGASTGDRLVERPIECGVSSSASRNHFLAPCQIFAPTLSASLWEGSL